MLAARPRYSWRGETLFSIRTTLDILAVRFPPPMSTVTESCVRWTISPVIRPPPRRRTSSAKTGAAASAMIPNPRFTRPSHLAVVTSARRELRSGALDIAPSGRRSESRGRAGPGFLTGMVPAPMDRGPSDVHRLPVSSVSHSTRSSFSSLLAAVLREIGLGLFPVSLERILHRIPVRGVFVGPPGRVARHSLRGFVTVASLRCSPLVGSRGNAAAMRGRALSVHRDHDCNRHAVWPRKGLPARSIVAGRCKPSRSPRGADGTAPGRWRSSPLAQGAPLVSRHAVGEGPDTRARPDQPPGRSASAVLVLQTD